jgi:hypothetical protein
MATFRDREGDKRDLLSGMRDFLEAFFGRVHEGD